MTTVSSNSYGYFGGGNVPSPFERIDFSNETFSLPGNEISKVQSGATSSDSYGYFRGGAPGNDTDTIKRLDFSNETFSDPGNVLTQARQMSAGISN